MASYEELIQAQAGWRYEPGEQLLAGKNIVVTGAGDGIGAAFAKTTACYGANVILVGRTREKLEVVFDWIEQETQTKPVIVPCDLEHLDANNVEALADNIEQTYGVLHGLVHSASLLGAKTPIAHYPIAEWQRVMQVNANAPFILTQGLFDLLDRSEDAKVLFISSSVGRQGRAYWGAYSASKFALEGLSQIFADETETAGNILVYSVNPGATRTAMRKAAYPMEDPTSVPLPESHMDMFLYLLDSPSYATGSQLDARSWSHPKNL
jgi:NAD(P)-dependent dehydrogenase (short-subunit alcohol dehydrogenase family)